ncbi:hypothetical protein AB0J38_14345 [Streptomyces sp. NPDC050095]|uniref:hypothetical protein n=1 Tax=unclassified Streptomyces TaxID=2593676 RepID=UPI00342FD987
MGCCGGGGGYRVGQWDSGQTPPKGAKVWRHKLPEGKSFSIDALSGEVSVVDADQLSEREKPQPHRDFVTWVEADASRALHRTGEYFQTIAEG